MGVASFSVEYRKPSSGRSGWKRCREQATLRLRVEGVGAGSSGAPQLCYEVDVSGKVHESGRLGAYSTVIRPLPVSHSTNYTF